MFLLRSIPITYSPACGFTLSSTVPRFTRHTRLLSRMSYSSYTTDKASPFTNAVVAAMRKLYPEELADKSFDNTGLLLEAPFDPIRRQMNSVLLTVDLTKAVADEAISRKDCVVVAYHPIIFRGLKSLTLADTQQQSLLRLALEGISVYSPHTAVDAAPEGLGDWLADIVTGKLSEPEPETHTAGEEEIEDVDVQTATPTSPAASKSSSTEHFTDAESSSEKPRPPLPPRAYLSRQYSSPSYPVKGMGDSDLTLSREDHNRKTIHPAKDGPPGAGMGRLVTFDEPQQLTRLIERIARGVGTPKGFPVAIPQGTSVEDIQIRTVAVCAGSGGSVFKGVNADLLFTGELSHHEALAATEQGRCVITLFHSNTERGYLHSVMRPKLLAALKDEWAKVRKEEAQREDPLEGWEDAIQDETIEVEVSGADRDPYGVVILQSSEQEGVPLS